MRPRTTTTLAICAAISCAPSACSPGTEASDSAQGSGATTTTGSPSTDTGIADSGSGSGSTGGLSTSSGTTGFTSGADSSSESEGASSTTGSAPFVALTDEQRMAFAHYYSPVIFKRASETAFTAGRDWITNFDFDRDGWELANNREHWLEGLSDHLAGGNQGWRVRPTLYTAVLEFERGGTHSLILLYHIYHAAQGDTLFEDIVPEAGSIHDWERIEVRIDGVSGDPGTTDSVTYVVITEHSTHVARLGNAPNLHYVDTAQGHHPMIFQAEHNDPLGVGFGELRFSETSAETLFGQTQAEINVNDAEEQLFHYIFVSEGDAELAAMVGAERLSSCNAATLASGELGGVTLAAVPRIAYEHQDLADVLPSHFDAGVDNDSWTAPDIPILLDEAIVDEAGVEEVPAGLQSFFAVALDDLDDEEDRDGYPDKHWFWGTYQWGVAESFTGNAFEDGTPNAMRCVANGHPDCLDNFWAQHDYFAHIGLPGDGTDDGEQGEWLPAGWHTPEAAGFDGRWVPLFDDAVDRDCE